MTLLKLDCQIQTTHSMREDQDQGYLPLSDTSPCAAAAVESPGTVKPGTALVACCWAACGCGCCCCAVPAAAMSLLLLPTPLAAACRCPGPELTGPELLPADGAPEPAMAAEGLAPTRLQHHSLDSPAAQCLASWAVQSSHPTCKTQSINTSCGPQFALIETAQHSGCAVPGNCGGSELSPWHPADAEALPRAAPYLGGPEPQTSRNAVAGR